MRVEMEMEFKTKPSGDLHTLPIFVTDIMFHTDRKRNTVDMTKKIGVDGSTRVYLDTIPKIKKVESEEIQTEVEVSANWKKNCEFVQELLSNDEGFKKIFLRAYKDKLKIEIIVPLEGIDIVVSPDTKQFINSTKGKRVLRKLAKK